MSVVHTSPIRIEKHEGSHHTAHIESFPAPVKGCIQCSWDADIEEA